MEPAGAKFDMMDRTRQFAVRVLRMSAVLPKDRASDVIARQLVKSGTSIGANYREAQHASSRKHFVTLLEIAQREAQETVYWLELIFEAELAPPAKMGNILQESREILAIITASVRTARRRR